MADYTILWGFETEPQKFEIEGHLLRSISGKQLDGLITGDIVWSVYVDESETLYLLGKLQVESVFDNPEDTEDFLGHPLDYRGQQGAKYAVAKPDIVYPMRWLDISNVAHRLRFDSTVSDRLNVDPNNGNRVDFWQLMKRRKLTSQGALELQNAWNSFSDDVYRVTFDEDHAQPVYYEEGQLREVKRTERVRNRELVNKAKRERLDQTGKLECEVCGFNFLISYGISYIEAHHIKPLSQQTGVSQRETTDLALLCANCHRVIHSRTPAMTVEELKSLVDSRKGRY